MKEFTILEITGAGGCGCCGSSQSYYAIIEGSRESDNVKSVIKEDIIDCIKQIVCEDEQKEILLEVDNLVSNLIEMEIDEIDIPEIDFTWKIINEEEWTGYYPAKKDNKKSISLIKKHKSIESVLPQEWAHITIKAEKAGKNPVMVKAGIKAAFSRRQKC